MKKLLVALTFFLSFVAHSTQELTYFVYSQAEYYQGPWSRAYQVDITESKYLQPTRFDDLFGSVEKEMVAKMLYRLKSINPLRYQWTYEFEIVDKVVNIKSTQHKEECETIKNEITATLVLNGFSAVVFQICGQSKETWTIESLTIPYFDLVSNELIEKPIVLDEPKKETKEETIHSDSSNSTENWNFWLVLFLVSSGLNVLLLLMFLIKRSK